MPRVVKHRLCRAGLRPGSLSRRQRPVWFGSAALAGILALGGMIGDGSRLQPAALPSPGLMSAAAEITLPRVILWAWERPEDLRFIDPHRVGVAFLAGTIEVRSPGPGSAALPDTTVILHPRLQPLLVPPGTALIAVVRVETAHDQWHQRATSPDGAAPLRPCSTAQRLRLAEMIAAVSALPGVRGVQVDYDAARSEQPFYRKLLEDVRGRLPRGMPLSITALASWCIGDNWPDSLPRGTLDEAVPMLFRMGPDGGSVAALVASGNEFPARVCRSSLGLSTDEAFSQALLSGRFARLTGRGRPERVYVFSNLRWNEAAVNRIVAEVER